ncbi:MAG: copper amine oxidase N-terminal domain-containing protein [Clostridiales bacterium]|jgi:multidrug efflux pump subunit AcrB|nr:copper amine oxidase N-terminal domain-containing protein [Eubacteriales bacterium]MDH7567459.1 copper amine oxidase N-terminal domain-containing protein [Clostridiales bacterium]
MKKSIKMLIIILVTILCFTSTSIVFAAGPSSTGSGGTSQNSSNSTTNISNTQDTENIKEEVKNSGGYENKNPDVDAKTSGNALKEQVRVLEQTQNTLRDQMKKLENGMADLENKYKEAVRTENQGQAQALQLQIQQKEQDINSSKDQLKQIREQIRETIRNSYTNEERNRLKTLEEELQEKYQDIKVLPVDSVVAKGTMIKFDTLPVIKEGRTLIPVRALTEGFGASVAWDQAKQEVTIQREEVKIVLQIGNNLAYVNGEEVKIDVPPETINNRTVVPLRFIVEKLGLKVNWDAESETVEIEDSQATNANE